MKKNGVEISIKFFISTVVTLDGASGGAMVRKLD